MKPYNATLPEHWIGRLELQMKWPPRSPDLTPHDFFLWGYVKKQVFVRPRSQDIDELKLRITAAIETVDKNMLERAWDEMDYNWIFVGSRMELTLSIVRLRKTFRFCHSNGTRHNCMAVILPSV
jgi:hypothetical protein